jgi:hypothetical protein
VDRLGNQEHSFIKRLFLNNDAVFKDSNAPYTKLELLSLGLKTVKVNFNIFPGH